MREASWFGLVAMVMAFGIAVAFLVAWLVKSGSRCLVDNLSAGALAVVFSVAVVAWDWLVFRHCCVGCAGGCWTWSAMMVTAVVVVSAWAAWLGLVCFLDVDWSWLG